MRRALLATRLGFARATEIAASIGQGVALALGFIGLFYNPMLIFIAIFVYLAASAEAHMVAMRAMSRGAPVSLGDDDVVRDAGAGGAGGGGRQTLLRTSQSEFPVVDAAGKLVGLLGRSDLIVRSSTRSGRPRRRCDDDDRAAIGCRRTTSRTRSASCRRNRPPRSPWSMLLAAWSASSPPKRSAKR